MGSPSKTIFVLIFLTITKIEIYAQSEVGYLLRCYVSSDSVKWKGLMDYNSFSGFLSEYDLKAGLVNKISFETVKEGDLFPLLVSDLFKNNLCYIDNTAYMKEFENNECKIKKVVVLKDLAFYDLIYTFHSKEDNFYYILLINKVEIGYCVLKQFSEFDFRFKKRIMLIEYPCFSALSTVETDTFKLVFQNLEGLKGDVFYSR